MTTTRKLAEQYWPRHFPPRGPSSRVPCVPKGMVQIREAFVELVHQWGKDVWESGNTYYTDPDTARKLEALCQLELENAVSDEPKVSKYFSVDEINEIRRRNGLRGRFIRAGERPIR